MTGKEIKRFEEWKKRVALWRKRASIVSFWMVTLLILLMGSSLLEFPAGALAGSFLMGIVFLVYVFWIHPNWRREIDSLIIKEDDKKRV